MKNNTNETVDLYWKETRLDKRFKKLGLNKIKDTDRVVEYQKIIYKKGTLDYDKYQKIVLYLNDNDVPLITSFEQKINIGLSLPVVLPLTGDEVELIFKKLRQKGWLK